MIIIIDLE